MISSCASAVDSSAIDLRRLPWIRSFLSRLLGLHFHVLLVPVLFGFAILAAPEHPHQQASICQAHNSVEACKVF